MTSDFLATLIRIRQNPYTSSLFNESPIFNDVRFLSDSGFLFSSKKKLCAEVIQTYFCIESISKNIWWHMRTTNLGMMYIFVSQALFLRPIDRFESVHTCCENDNILQSCRNGWILICWANTFMQHTYTLDNI